jgi:hypothetical protein
MFKQLPQMLPIQCIFGREGVVSRSVIGLGLSVGEGHFKIGFLPAKSGNVPYHALETTHLPRLHGPSLGAGSSQHKELACSSGDLCL